MFPCRLCRSLAMERPTESPHGPSCWQLVSARAASLSLPSMQWLPSSPCENCNKLSKSLPFLKNQQWEISEQPVPCYSLNDGKCQILWAQDLAHHTKGQTAFLLCNNAYKYQWMWQILRRSWGCIQAEMTLLSQSLNCISVCVLQVFPDVLHVCELGLRSADAAENSKLETSLQVLPLVSSAATKEWKSGFLK